MKINFDKNFVFGWGLLLLIGFTFWSGGKSNNLVRRIFYPPMPTPTPDTRTRVGETMKVKGLELTIVDAWRIVRAQEFLDLGIITVSFKGTDDCYDSKNKFFCTFNRDFFQLFNNQGEEQTVSLPPRRFISGMKILKLAPSRSLTSLTSETGQIYFLLDKNTSEFTLIYSSKEGDVVRFLVKPKTYTSKDARKNLQTTPQPEYGVVEEKN